MVRLEIPEAQDLLVRLDIPAQPGEREVMVPRVQPEVPEEEDRRGVPEPPETKEQQGLQEPVEKIFLHRRIILFIPTRLLTGLLLWDLLMVVDSQQRLQPVRSFFLMGQQGRQVSVVN